MIGVILVFSIIYIFTGIISCWYIVESIKVWSEILVWQIISLLFYLPISIVVIILYVIGWIIKKMFMMLFDALSNMRLCWLNKTVYKWR